MATSLPKAMTRRLRQLLVPGGVALLEYLEINKRVGDRVTLLLLRDGQPLTREATLAAE